MHQSIIGYRKARFLWTALILSAAAIGAYAWSSRTGPVNGGTWTGYTLGVISAALVVWLMSLGVRKRSYSSQLGSVQGWTSAHIYLGAAVFITASLHSALQIGWNVHSLAYVLLCLVILSGLFGVHAYRRYPDLVAANRAGMTREQVFKQVQDLDRQCLRTAGEIDAETQALVQSAAERTSVGGGWWPQITGRDDSRISLPATYAADNQRGQVRNADQRAVIDLVSRRLARTQGGAEVTRLQNLLSTLVTKQGLLRRIRRDIRYQALLEIWLYVHVPLSFGLLGALVVHVVSVFIYW